jgi:phosphodiesterase/alkaline phosphatase D-like protein
MKRAMLLLGLTALIAGPVAVAASAAISSPSVTTGGSTSITTSGASVQGTVNPEGQATQYAFQYGTTNAYGHETRLTATGAGHTALTVAATIGGLVPGTTYHYRVIAISAGGVATGADQTFKTAGTAPPPPPVKPVVTTGTAGAVTTGGATVSGSVNPSGLATKYYFEFGPTSAYGYQTAAVGAGSGTSPKSVSTALTDLASNQTYHYRLDAVSSAGTVLGADEIFKTATPPPGASSLRLFGRTGFVSASGVGGVLVGCIGDTLCKGSLVVSRGGVTLAERPVFVVGANDGGVVHVALNATGQSMLNQAHHLRVNVTVSGGAGQPSSGVLTLVQFQ